MTSEVTSHEFGRVHARVLRRLPADAREVRLTIVGSRGTTVTDTLTIVLKPSGRGSHRRFACPRCSGCVAVITMSGPGFACLACAKVRSRRQAERTTRVWRHLGGDLEDRIVRHIGAGRLREARVALAELRAQDAHRVELLQRDVQVALAMLGAST